jgi:IS5 family transposase
MFLEKGSIVDASIKRSYTRPTCGRDPDARFTKRGDEIYYGYKAHIGIDSTTKVIHSVEFTPTNVHDSQMFGYLVTGRECMVIGDKGYADERRKSRLRKAGIYCGILIRGIVIDR